MLVVVKCPPPKTKPKSRPKKHVTDHPCIRRRRYRELKRMYDIKLAHVYASSICAWAFPNCNNSSRMLASAKEDYHAVPENVQNDPRALILDLHGLLIHKVDLEEDIFFPPWNLEYDQVLQERPRRIYFLVRPDASQFLLWEANHFHVFI